jgi:hypothetical protein
MVVKAQLQYSQRESQTQLVPDTQPGTQSETQPETQLSELFKTPSISSEDESSASTDPDTDNSNPEPHRSGRVRRPTRGKASQLSQEAAMAKAKAKEKGERRKMRKSIPTSQLLEEFGIDLQ